MDGVDVIVLAEALIAFAVFLVALKVFAKTAAVISGVTFAFLAVVFTVVKLAQYGVIH